MKQFAYCPIELKHETVSEYVKPFLKDGCTIVVHKRYTGELHHREIQNTSRNEANSYGSDLYLFSVDTSGKETYFSCGSFN